MFVYLFGNFVCLLFVATRDSESAHGTSLLTTLLVTIFDLLRHGDDNIDNTLSFDKGVLSLHPLL